jgi:hypothetical protein
MLRNRLQGATPVSCHKSRRRGLERCTQCTKDRGYLGSLENFEVAPPKADLSEKRPRPRGKGSRLGPAPRIGAMEFVRAKRNAPDTHILKQRSLKFVENR